MPQQRLTYSGTDIDWQTLHGSKELGELSQSILISKNGTLWINQVYALDRWQPLVVLQDATEAGNINSWVANRRTCTFYPDYSGAPGVSHSVKLLNEEYPMQLVSEDGPTYEGSLDIRVLGP